jgi:hypothetical protein
MLHADFDRESYAERYVLGHLKPEDEATFEDHLMGCAQCQDAVDAVQGLREGFRGQARTLAAPPRATQLWRPMALAATAALALTLGLLWRQAADADRQAEAARLEVAAVQHTLSEELATLRGQQSGKVDTLEQELAAARAAAADSAKAASAPGKLAAPLAGLPIYLLATVRDRPTPLTLDSRHLEQGFTLAVDAAPDPRFQRWRVTLQDADGKSLFDRADLQPTALDAVLVTFPAGFLPPGTYTLGLAGQDAQGQTTELARHQLVVR